MVYNFPPYIRAGSMRTWGWLDNFSDDFEFVVITRKWENNKIYNISNYYDEDEIGIEQETISEYKNIIRVPNKHNWYFKLKFSSFSKKISLPRLFTFTELLFRWLPFSFYENERGLYKEARKYIANNTIDILLSSGEPFVLFKYCYLLKKEFNVKIALDYRDGWSTNAFKKMNANYLLKIILNLDRKYEKKILKSADLLLFVSDKLRKEVLTIAPSFESKTLVVNNGIDTKVNVKYSNQNDNEIFLKKDEFNVVFIGSIYEGHHVEWLEDITCRLQKKMININFYFVGSLITCPYKKKKVLLHFQKTFPKNVFFIDYVDNSISIEIQKRSTVLLKFNAFEQREGHFGKKMYEYAVSGKKVISINFEPNFNNRTGFFDNKPFVYYCNTPLEVESCLFNFYQLWLNGDVLDNEILEDELEEYSVIHQVKNLEKVLLSICE